MTEGDCVRSKLHRARERMHREQIRVLGAKREREREKGREGKRERIN